MNERGGVDVQRKPANPTDLGEEKGCSESQSQTFGEKVRGQREEVLIRNLKPKQIPQQKDPKSIALSWDWRRFKDPVRRSPRSSVRVLH